MRSEKSKYQNINGLITYNKVLYTDMYAVGPQGEGMPIYRGKSCIQTRSRRSSIYISCRPVEHGCLLGESLRKYFSREYTGGLSHSNP